MIKRFFQKLYSGNIASLRDYEVRDGIKAGGMVFIYGDKVMTKNPDELRRNFQCHQKEIRSKFNPNQTYKLVDFVFVDDKDKIIKEERQLKLI